MTVAVRCSFTHPLNTRERNVINEMMVIFEFMQVIYTYKIKKTALLAGGNSFQNLGILYL